MPRYAKMSAEGERRREQGKARIKAKSPGVCASSCGEIARVQLEALKMFSTYHQVYCSWCRGWARGGRGADEITAAPDF